MKKKYYLFVLIVMVFCVSCRTFERSEDTIVLKGNATTGYMWSAIPDNSGVYEVVKEEYVPDSSNHLVGAGGKYSAVIQSVREGKGLVMFEYKRPWETEAIERIKFEITVDKKGRVTHKSMTL